MSDREIDVLDKAVAALVKSAEAAHPKEAEELRIAMQTLRLEHEFLKRNPKPQPKFNWRMAAPGLLSALAILITAVLAIFGIDVKGLLPQ